MSKIQGDARAKMRAEYDFKDGIRGKYASQFPMGSKIIVLDPDVAEVFPDADAVNEASEG